MALLPNATQFEGTGESPPKDIVIGFDFGTSCTKVVLQDPPARKAYAVPFGEHAYPDNPFLLSSRLGLASSGKCRLVRFDQPAIRGIKRQLMLTPMKFFRIGSSSGMRTNAVGLASIYVALVLQHVRRWFLSEFRVEYGRNTIRWHLNLGIPSKNYDEKEIRGAFLTAARLGWWLSVRSNPVTLDEASLVQKEASTPDFNPGSHPDLLQVVPEVAAEVAGYARSPLRELGLHMILDIGAGTTDVATFRLQTSQEGLEYWFLWAEVSKHACHDLHNCRLQKVRQNFEIWCRELKTIDDLGQGIPSSYDEYRPPESDLLDIDRRFIENAKGPITRVAAISYTRRDPNAREWQRGVPLFLCGGGSSLPLLRNDLIAAVQKGLGNYNIGQFKIKSLPKPDNLQADGLGTERFHRLAVAYGLSFFYDDIGRTVPPSNIGNIQRHERIRVVDEAIGKEHV